MRKRARRGEPAFYAPQGQQIVDEGLPLSGASGVDPGRRHPHRAKATPSIALRMRQAGNLVILAFFDDGHLPCNCRMTDGRRCFLARLALARDVLATEPRHFERSARLDAVFCARGGRRAGVSWALGG